MRILKVIRKSGYKKIITDNISGVFICKINLSKIVL